MEHHRLVLPEHLNDQGNLFGGYLLKWLDEFAYITVNVEFPGHRFVTIGLDDVAFRRPIDCGQILRFLVSRVRTGKTSVAYEVEVSAENPRAGGEGVLFATRITFVNVDEHGNKSPIRRGDG